MSESEKTLPENMRVDHRPDGSLIVFYGSTSVANIHHDGAVEFLLVFAVEVVPWLSVIQEMSQKCSEQYKERQRVAKIAQLRRDYERAVVEAEASKKRLLEENPTEFDGDNASALVMPHGVSIAQSRNAYGCSSRRHWRRREQRWAMESDAAPKRRTVSMIADNYTPEER